MPHFDSWSGLAEHIADVTARSGHKNLQRHPAERCEVLGRKSENPAWAFLRTLEKDPKPSDPSYYTDPLGREPKTQDLLDKCLFTPWAYMGASEIRGTVFLYLILGS